MVMSHQTSPVERILGWLRGGYPEGVPQHDYVALFGILHRSLTSAEVEDLAHRLREAGGSDVPDEQIREAIRSLALEEPDEQDVRRVASRLAQGGWPLAEPSVAESVGKD